MKLLFWNVNLIDNETAIEDQVAQLTERVARKVGSATKSTYTVGKAAARGFSKGISNFNGPSREELLARITELENLK